MWGLVVVLFGVVVVGEDWVGAQKVVPTDTTAAGRSSGDGTGSDGVGTRDHCEGNRHRPDGTCRACPELDQFYNGSGCEDKIESHPDDPPCSASEIADGNTVYYSSYGGCRPPPSACDNGRGPNGFCRPSTGTTQAPLIPARPVDPAPPSSVTADGDSRGVTGLHSSGSLAAESSVEWRAGSRRIVGHTLAHYEVRYGEVDDPSEEDRETAVTTQVYLLPDSWGTPSITVPAGTTSIVLRGLAAYQLYRIEVRGVYAPDNPPPPVGGVTPPPVYRFSDWEHAYTYPTRTAAPNVLAQMVGVVPVTRYRPPDPAITNDQPGTYRWVSCTNADLIPAGILTSDRNKLFSQISAGVRTWAATGIVRNIRSTPKECTDTDLSTSPATDHLSEVTRRAHTNVVVLAATGDQMMDLCGTSDSRACVVHTPRTGVEIRSTKIVINQDVKYKANFGTAACSEAYMLAMHEAGHAFGLGDTTSASADSYGKWPSVMSQSVYSNCVPTGLDVAALKAIYQSRQ